jgi:CheY-like chemotaxis protein
VAGSTVLVVDDEPRIVEFLVENLSADDFSVLTASNGEQALDVLGHARPDVVLLDVVLPDMSGYDVCRRVRSGDAIVDPWDPISRLSCSAPRPSIPTGFAGSRAAPTTTSRSHFTTPSCWPASAHC